MSWDKVGADIERGPLGAIKWLVIISVVLFAVFGELRTLGLIGGKAVERAVIKQSFQYKEGMAQRSTILKASIEEIDITLRSATPDAASGLRKQRAILSAQLRAITINE